MYLFRAIFVTLFIFCHCLITEGGNLKKICKALEKARFEKAEKAIFKSLQKDSLNPGAKYFLSALLIHEDYVYYDMDSSWYWANRAIADMEGAGEDVLKALHKVELDLEDMLSLRNHISELAFNKSTSQMSVASFDHYLDTYPETDFYERATYIRDSLAFDMALSHNTWSEYQKYFTVYPNSIFVPEARKRYQTLIFKDYTKDDRLISYVRFLEEHPDTPFRKLAEEVILKRSVLDHSWESYVDFLEKYPDSHLRKLIGDILYYKTKAGDIEKMVRVLNLHPDPDSLRVMYELEKRVLFPVLEGGVFGFMSAGKELILKPQFNTIAQDQLCGNLTSEWLLVGNKVINRKGEQVITDVHDISDLGEGVVLTGDQGRLYHKSGYRISDLIVDDARLLTQGLIAFLSGADWGLMTMLGHQLLPPQYQSIRQQGDFLIVEEEGLFKVSSLDQVTTSGSGISFVSEKFDDYEVIGDTLLQGFDGDKECLLSRDLEFLIHPDVHTIYVSRDSWYVKDKGGYQLYDKTDTKLMNQKFELLDINEGWIGVKRTDGWMLISKEPDNLLVMKELDSVKLINASTAYLKRGDTLQLIFQNGKRQWLQPEDRIRVLHNHSASYLLYESGKYQKLFDREGKVLFDGRYEAISLLGDSLFRFEKGDKIGVLNKKGEVLVAPGYDLADENGGLIFLLKGTEIGCYDNKRDLLIPAKYQARILPFGDNHYKIQKNGKVGLLDTLKNEAVPAVYDQLIHWNDTCLWARSASEWKMLNFGNKTLLEGIKSVKIWLQNADETYAIILSDNGYGLLSNVNGEILSSEYNDILNVGTESTPVFFAEQHLKTASFYVATYFDRHGQTIRSQAFRPEEYERIYCDE